MTVKIDQKIVGVEVVSDEAAPAARIIEPYQRPAKLAGTTYKLKPSTSDAALYVTINDIVLPDGTTRPFEIFINTKDKTHDQFITAMTRLISAVFRMPLPFEFVIEELKEVAATDGSYFLRSGDPAGRGRVKGIVDHIGRVVEAHCRERGIIRDEPDEVKAQAIEALNTKLAAAQVCAKCGEQSVYYIDGCWTCRSCGDSKCS